MQVKETRIKKDGWRWKVPLTGDALLDCLAPTLRNNAKGWITLSYTSGSVVLLLVDMQSKATEKWAYAVEIVPSRRYSYITWYIESWYFNVLADC